LPSGTATNRGKAREPFYHPVELALLRDADAPE
jgi:hypothetical protein